MARAFGFAIAICDSHVYWLERFVNDQNVPGTTMGISEIRLEGEVSSRLNM